MSELLEEILSRENMMLAYKRVKASKGASGVDGITVDEIDGYLKENWKDIKEQSNLKYLGFGFWKDRDKWKARLHQNSVRKFERTLKKLTKRNWSVGMDERIQRLNQVIRGWINYFLE